MRFSFLQLILALTILGSSLAEGSGAQPILDKRVSINRTGLELKKILTELEQKYKVNFVYSPALINVDDKIDLKFRDTPLSEVLKQLLDKKELYFEVSGDVIVIRNTKTSGNYPVLPKEVSPPAEIPVSGRITDEKGDPVPGVTINIKGSTKGTVSDPDGKYQLTVLTGNETLVFKFVGYKTQEISLDTRRQLNVSLEPDVTSLNEVAVVAYGIQKKESLVASISTVNVRDVKQAAPRSLTNALAGKVSGLISVQRSGEPGYDDAQFWIRGISTFGAGASPLVLVDGVERPISNIEPEEIATISVLKDAAATSVYGVRGANGVILVTTRRGSTQKPAISFKLEQGSNRPTRLQDYVDGPTWLTLYNEAQLATNPSFVTPYTPAIIDKYRSGEDPYLYPNVDWLDLILKDHANNQRANLNVTGGSDMSKYFISAGYYQEDGIWKGDNLNAYNTNAKVKRYNFRANVDVNLNKYTELSLGLGGILVTSNYPGTSSGNIWSTIQNNTPIGYSPTYPDPANPGKSLYGGISSLINPYAQLTGTGFITEWRNNIQTDLTLRHDLSRFVKGLTIQGKFAFDGYNYHNINQIRSYLANSDQVDKYFASGRDAAGNLILSRLVTGKADLGFSKAAGGNRRIYVQANIDYSRSFGKHDVKALLLYNQQDYQDADATDAISALPFRLQGVVSRLSYGYNNRYFLEVSAGYNGSENFSPGHRYGLFPAVAAGWIVSQESFFKNNISWIEYLKLRGSWGIKGNDQIGGRRFAYLTTVGGGNGSYTFGIDANNGFGGRGEDQWGADLTWEKEREVDLGLETRFLNGFNIQADVFKRHRKGIFLQRASLPATLGLQNNPYGNLGEMENKGFEATVEYRARVGALDATFRGNYTYARNKLLNTDQPDYLYNYQNRVGKRYNQPFGLIALGLFQDQQDIANSPVQQFGAVRPGDIKYMDYNNDGVVNAYDQVAIGNPAVPQSIYGFGTTLALKGFDFSVFFQGNGSASFTLGGTGWYPFQGGGLIGNLNVNSLDRWTPDNPRQDALFPRLSFGSNTNNYQTSTWWQRDAAYIRLKTAELGYTLPKSLTKRLKINTLRVYASGLNLYTWSKFKFWDPELGSANGGAYPIQKTFNFGVNLNL
ncbi:TonB-dependent receptor [Mucilaginibacter sp. PAMB04168]|uniref:TonB-dependent receptor n=1 Tax=Mucilaginibacter sp. PAMB04168 TaxID=3138567 RepID=UPI0031F6EA92